MSKKSVPEAFAADMSKKLAGLHLQAGDDPEKSALLEATMEKLDKILTSKSVAAVVMEHLHPTIRARVQALQDLQDTYDTLEDEFIEAQRALVLKYERLYKPLYDERATIIAGGKDDVIASKAAADAADSGGDQQGAEHSVVAYYKLPEGGSSAEDVPAGIPEFWSHCMRSNDVLMEKITEKDEDVLRYLTDIRYELLGNDEPEQAGAGEQEGAEADSEDDDEADLEGFRLFFHFAKNPHFTNDILVKTYKMVDEEDGILEKAEGSDILWNPGKNVTVKVLRKKNKKGKRGGASDDDVPAMSCTGCGATFPSRSKLFAHLKANPGHAKLKR